MEGKIELLLEKYLDDTVTIEEERLLDEWYESLGTEQEFHISEAELERVKERMWDAICAKTIGLNTAPSPEASVSSDQFHDRGISF